MTDAVFAAAAFCGATLAVHLVSVVVAVVRCRPAALTTAPDGLPPVTIVRPVCGLENFIEETLRSGFKLEHPQYELILCVAHADDAVVPLVRRLIAEHPHVDARLLVGDERVSRNPKLNNCVKGWNAAAHRWIVLADSNVLMPPDYLQRLLSRWDAKTGLVCSPPVGMRPEGFWAGLECAFLNTHQARWQYTADTLGHGFAQGKTMLWRRADLEAAGGIRVLGEDAAEDAASTKVIRASGLKVRLVDAPFPQPLGQRRLSDVWRRQSRWARLRRVCFPSVFLPELLCGAVFPTIALAFVALALDWPVVVSLAALLILWYGAEMVLARAAGWPLDAFYPLHAIMRDLMLPVLWADGWLGSNFEWRGNPMSIDESGDESGVENSRAA
jgi:ceramide glucosyltransferase